MWESTIGTEKKEKEGLFLAMEVSTRDSLISISPMGKAILNLLTKIATEVYSTEDRDKAREPIILVRDLFFKDSGKGISRSKVS